MQYTSQKLFLTHVINIICIRLCDSNELVKRSLMSAVSFGLLHGTPLCMEVRHFILGSQEW